MFKKSIIVLSVLLSLVAPLKSHGGNSEPIDVGVVVPLSGELAIFGEKLRQGYEMAKAEFPGRFNLIFEDGEFSNSKALSALQKIIATSKAKVILGPFGPGQTFSLAAPAAKEDVALIAVALCQERFAELNNALCTYPSAEAQFVPIIDLFEAKYVKDIKTLGLIMEEVEAIDRGKNMAESFARRNNIKILKSTTFSSKAPDFRSLLFAMRDMDLFIFGGMPTKAVTAMRQLRELQIKPRYIWLWTEHDQELFKKHQDLFEGVFITGGLTDFSPWFMETFKTKFGKKPDLYHAIAYDAAAALFRLLAEKNYQSGKKIVSLLINNPPEKTACNGFRFNTDHTVSMSLDVDLITKGKQKNILRRKAELN